MSNRANTFVTVTYIDGTVTPVQILNPDRVRYDLHRHRLGWPEFKEAPFLGITFWAWAAFKRLNLTELDFEPWCETVADIVSNTDDAPHPMENPTQQALGRDI